MRRFIMRAYVAVAAGVVLGIGGVAGASPSGAAPQALRAAWVSAAGTPHAAVSPGPWRTILPQHRPSTHPTVVAPPAHHNSQFPGAGPCDITYCWTPGEPVIAVGTSDVVETVNTVATVYSKSTGTLLATFDFENFWDGSGNDQCVDPRALYLASVDRFAISCTDITGGPDPMRFAISQTNDPTGGWYKYTVPNSGFLDQDKIVATSDKFIIAGNASTNEQFFVYNLSDVVAGVPNPGVVHLVGTKSNIYQAAVEQTATSPAYFVSSYPGNVLYLATITGSPAAANVAIKEKKITSTDYPAPQEPAVPGGNIGGGNLDGRIYDAVYEVETSDNHPVIQYSSARECGSRTCITSARIDLSFSPPKLRYNNLIGEPGWDYSYGAVGLDGAGNVYEAYARSNPSTPPAAAVVGPGFDVTLMQPAAGTTSCSSWQTPPCDEHWGDYLSTTIDPTDPTKVWVSGLYQNTSGGYGWGSITQELSVGSFALPTVTDTKANSVTSTRATVNVTVNPKGAATTIHVDYGQTSGYDSATPAIAVGSGTSPVTKTVVLSGLTPGTVYHFRAVATTSVGNATTKDRTFATTTPTISSVVFSGPSGSPTVTINGSGFGTAPSGQPANCGTTGSDFDTNQLWLHDGTGWTAGQFGDCIGLIVGSWTNTSVTYTFGSGYSVYGTLSNGDTYSLAVQEAQTSGTVSGLS